MNIFFEKSYQRGFGTYPLKGEILTAAITTALDVGYRAFDTAQMYGNEQDTGAALAETAVPRVDLCITTKVHPENYTEARFIASVEKSLKDLNLDYVDVLLLHWPAPPEALRSTLLLLEKALKRGLTRNIGVSNFTVQMMRDAVDAIETPLVTNQVEFHPLLNQDRLLEAAFETGIPLSSYASVARGEIFKHGIFEEIGRYYNKSAAQVVLRWILQKGVALNTMSTKAENIRANFEIMDFTLSSIDMAGIEVMTETGYRVVTSDLVPWAPEWD